MKWLFALFALALLHFVGLERAFRLLDAADSALHDAYEQAAPAVERKLRERNHHAH